MTTPAWIYFTHFLTYCILFSLSLGNPLYGKNVRDAKINELPFVVSIERRGLKNSNFCTGTLISRQNVLTAAHCLYGLKTSDIVVMVGSVNLRLGKRYGVKSWKTYDQWFYETDHLGSSPDDIAILTLAHKVKDCDVKPASVLTFAPEDLFNSKIRIAGWGDSESFVKPEILKTAVLKVISNDECELKIESGTKEPTSVPEHLFCSLADPFVLGSCGDSGAPILNKRNQVVGIHRGVCPLSIQDSNYTKEFIHQNLVNIHLNLYDYRQFIRSFLQ